MKAESNLNSREAPSDGRKAALIELLTDDDSAVYVRIRDEILAYGPSASDWLRPHTLSNNPVRRQRAREIVKRLAQQAADDEFLAFCLRHGDDLDLETGALLLSRTAHPEANPEGYRAILDLYAAELRPRLGDRTRPERVIAAVNRRLFSELRYSGNEKSHFDPDNNYLTRVIDQRMGNPAGLSLLYLLLCRRLELPVTGIGMPGYFVLRFQSSVGQVYVDVFHQGRILSKADCVQYLLQTTGFQESHLAPMKPRGILLRLCANIHQAALRAEGSSALAARVKRYIVALSNK